MYTCKSKTRSARIGIMYSIVVKVAYNQSMEGQLTES